MNSYVDEDPSLVLKRHDQYMIKQEMKYLKQELARKGEYPLYAEDGYVFIKEYHGCGCHKKGSSCRTHGSSV